VRCSNGDEYSSVCVIVTVPAPVANVVVRGLSHEKREALAAVQYVALTQMALRVRNVPSAEELAGVMFIPGNTAASVCQTGSIAGSPATGTVISASITDQKKVDLSDKECLAAIGEDLTMVNREFDTERVILDFVIERWKVGEVHMTPGFLSKYQELLKEPAGNVYFAGDYVSDFPTWGGAVWAGAKAAREVLAVMRQ
jgi:monoamine oxidase